MSAKSIAYRPEIDGLRAICVLAVILFHARVGFSGGFVGVDIFFVISGYLISKIVLAEIQAGSFSLVGFWERRIRRIFPAVLFMNVLVLVFGLLIYFPVDYYNLLVASRYLVFGVPNFYYWNALDYFAESSTMFPLLHTWSLGVEEQFYVVFPLLMAFLARRWHTRLFGILVAVCAVSFAVSVYQVRTGHSATAFFLLPGRAWELLAGCLLTLRNPLKSLSRNGREAVSLAGLGGMLFAMFAYEEGMSFPGTAALMPVVAACGFIASNGTELTRTGRFLARPGFVMLGKMSFSLYLWHWPLTTFATLYFPDHKWLPPIAALLSFPVAWFSWRHIEEPFRRKEICISRPAVFRFFIAANVCLLAFFQLGSRTNGFHQRTWAMPASAQELYRINLDDFTFAPMAARTQADFLAGKNGKLGGPACGEPWFFLWGDSHAMAVSRTFDEVARQLGIGGLYAFSLGLDIVPPGDPATYPHIGRTPNSFETNARILEKLAAEGVGNIVLISRWSHALDYPQGPEDLRRFLRFIREKSPESTVYVFQEVPQQRYRRRVFFYQTMLSETIGWPFVFRPTDRRDFEALNRSFETAMAGFDDPKVVRIDCPPEFFDPSGKLVHREGQRSYYVDEDHLSLYGSDRIMRPVIEHVLARIAEAASSSGNTVAEAIQTQADARPATNAVSSSRIPLRSN